MCRYLFLGDSITQFWQHEGDRTWQRLFAEHAVNLGVSGETTYDVLARIRSVRFGTYSPAAVLLLIGANDLLMGGNPATIVKNIESILSELRHRFQGAAIVLHGVLPLAGSRDYARAAAVRVNQMLQQVAARERIRWFSPWDHFVEKDGEIPRALMPDGVHLTAAAYEMWGELLAPVMGAAADRVP